MANSLPETIAYISVTQQSWQQGRLVGEVRAADNGVFGKAY
jgi:hypothetical protein